MEAYIGTKVINAEPVPATEEHVEDGYRVRYSDGYESWSPRQVFEEAYRQSGSMSFGHAIYMLKTGERVARSGWNGKGMWLKLQVPDAGSKMTLPYIYINTVNDDWVPWVASQTDMLADDWGVVAK